MAKNIKAPANSDSQVILGFEGYYSFLSNDYPSWVMFENIKFPSISTAFQAARTEDIDTRQKIANVSDIEEFKNIAMSIKNPSDWNQKKQKIMENLIRDKFKRNKQLLQKFIGTKDKKIVNVMKNPGYNEQFWGVYDGKGKNALGKILMSIREQFNKSLDTKKWIQNNLNLQNDSNMFAKVSLLVMKDGKKVQRLHLDKNKNYYLFGSLKNTDFFLQNPTISRNHACIYFDNNLEVLIVDLNSTHKTFIKRKGDPDKIQLEGLISYRLYKDDVIQFGTSARQYVVDIDRTQVQKYIVQQQNNLKESAKLGAHKIQNSLEFQKLEKDQARKLLGISQKCILIQELRELDNYNKIKQYFSKFEKIKNLRMKTNLKTGKCQGSAVLYLENQLAVKNLFQKRKQLIYKIKLIDEDEAQSILNIPTKRKKSRSKSKQRQKSRQRERSREKRQKKKNQY